FFEMLGNFSFGDYFKREAIQFAWRFLTEELGLPKEKLWVTVYEEDDEAATIWLDEIGVSKDQFARIGAKDNFWAMGDVGPCGPCSEIFYDHGDAYWGGPPGTPDEDGDRYIEIWNLVFMQFDRDKEGNLTPLPKPSVDTGMGLERIAAVMQHVNNNYQIDLFDNLISFISDLVSEADRTHHSVRVIADHIRSCAFMLVDGVTPSNEGRGYVLRRIIRRAVRHGYQLGAQTPFFWKIVQPLVDEMGQAYPELVDKKDQIEAALKKEEIRFAETLDQGLKIFEQKMTEVDGDTVPGDLVFLLYDTYGFPVDLTADVARERQLTMDMDGYEALMDQQRQQAKSSAKFAVDDELGLDIEQATEFVGYAELKGESRVLAMTNSGEEKTVLVLDRTPFYAEGGGQVGDVGAIKTNSATMQVEDCKKLANGAFLHIGVVSEGEFSVGDVVQVEVDQTKRFSTAANHSATHLLHSALKRVLGDHVQQRGSMVNHERLRFDFSHEGPVTSEQITEIENLVNLEVFKKSSVESSHMPIADAKAAGAEALFDEKYGEVVRVISMGEHSLELCGGTHVSNTSEVGLFKIVGESGVAAGVRRLEAVSQSGAVQWVNEQQSVLKSTAEKLKTAPANLETRIDQLLDSIKSLEADKKQLQKMLASGAGSNPIAENTKQIGDVTLAVATLEGADKDLLRETIDQFKDKHEAGIIVIGAEIDEKVRLVAGVSKPIAKQYPAGDLIKHITALAGGRGGGRPDMAEGGIAEVADLSRCLDEVENWLTQRSAA
ncbi:MAG: alanine--tRNA ligase, partial [Pseudomonadota bacterium]